MHYGAENDEAQKSNAVLYFMDVTGSDATTATSILSKLGWEVHSAVIHFYEKDSNRELSDALRRNVYD